MADLVTQPNSNPTNKLTAATIAAGVVALVRVFVIKFAPEFDDPEIWAMVTPLAVFAAGWLTRDKPNVPTVEAPPVDITGGQP